MLASDLLLCGVVEPSRESCSFLERQSSFFIFAVASALMIAIGAVDCLSGYDVSMFIFYAIPILLTVWFCDGKVALLMALLCGLTWWWADTIARHPYAHGWLAIWEPAMRFAYFIIVAVMGARLRRQHNAVRSRVALLEHSQRLEREIVQISEEERRRIGQDLHDGICQHLAGITCAAASLSTRLSRQELRREAAMADEVTELLKDSIVQTRDLARGLVPVQMDEAGLPSALQELAASVSRLQNVDCRFLRHDPAPVCTTTTATHLYRIAQEAIANAIRHGRADRIEIDLTGAIRGPRLRIFDNGSGILPEAHLAAGIGLKIMAYRARLVRGELTITRVDGGGTEVTCTFGETAVEDYERAA